MITLVEIGKRVEKIRLSKKLTHEELCQLAERAGYPISQPSISKLENGQGKEYPSARLFLGLSAALGTTPNVLLGWSAEERQFNQPLSKTVEATLLSDMVDELSDENRKKAMTFVQSLQRIESAHRQHNNLYLQEVLDGIKTADPKVRERLRVLLQDEQLTMDDVVQRNGEPVEA